MKNKAVNFNFTDFEIVKTIDLTFSDTEESIKHYGTPSVKVRGKLVSRLHKSLENLESNLEKLNL